MAKRPQKRGARARALTLFKDLSARCEAELGADHVRTLLAIASTALCLQEMGQTEEALPMHQKVRWAWDVMIL